VTHIVFFMLPTHHGLMCRTEYETLDIIQTVCYDGKKREVSLVPLSKKYLHLWLVVTAHQYSLVVPKYL
jgi:hypothetical protein